MRFRMISGGMVAIMLVAMAISGWAASKPSTTQAAAAFERLKGLAGDWESTGKDGSKSHVNYEVVSGGSAVVEHFENDAMGPSNAMITVYYLDGSHLLLSHFCMAKNQPRMQAQSYDAASGELRFVFLDATGLSSPQAGHMHDATFRFADNDHFAAEWQFYEGGKLKMTESASYTRVR